MLVLDKFSSSQLIDGTTSVATSNAALLLLLSEPAAIASLPFVRELSRERQSELLLQIARQHLFGANSVPLNATAATQWLYASADTFGNPTAQFLLGALVAASAGSTGDVDATAASAVLHHHFAALGGSIASSMALGYRYLHGYGVPQSCEHALRHYKFAADRVVSAQSAVRPIQVFSTPAPFRLSDSGDRKSRPTHADEDAHRMEYLQQRARRSSDPQVLEKAASVVLFSDIPHASATAATMHAQHDRSLEARVLLERAAQLGSFSAKALLGHVYAYGLGGSRKDVNEAVRLYREALNESAIVNATSAEAANGLGLLYFHGAADTGVDYERAMQLFKVSARSGHADGIYNAGVLMAASHPQLAHEYLEASAHAGHLKAQFKLARLKEKQRFRTAASASLAPSMDGASCKDIVALYKTVAEHADEGSELLAHAASAFSFANDWDHALTLYLAAAEMGYEVAESNVAWLLERQRQRSQQWWWRQERDAHNSLYRRLVLRGVAQDSAEAHVRYGDLLFADSRFALALLQYELADDLSHGKHGRALFSIGYMHEHGLGVLERSLEKARLYYELLAQVEPAMRDVAWLLQLKLTTQTWFETLMQRIVSACSLVARSAASKDSSVADAEPTPSDLVSEQLGATPVSAAIQTPSNEASTALEGVTFASALRFSSESRLLVESPAATQSFAIELWLRIATGENENENEEATGATHMVLLDLQDTYQLELVRSAVDVDDGSDAWELHYRTASALFVFADAPLSAGEWCHITVTAALESETRRTLSLFVNAELRQAFEYSQQAQAAHDSASATRVLAVGSSLTRSATSSAVHCHASMSFVGSVMHVRVWHSHKSANAVRELMATWQDELVSRDVQASADLAVELHFDIQRVGSSIWQSHAKDSLAHTTSPVRSNTRVFTSVAVDPEVAQFPPEVQQMKRESSDSK